VRRAVAAAFPAGLPEWDPVRRILEGLERPEPDSEVGILAQNILERRVYHKNGSVETTCPRRAEHSSAR